MRMSHRAAIIGGQRLFGYGRQAAGFMGKGWQKPEYAD